MELMSLKRELLLLVKDKTIAFQTLKRKKVGVGKKMKIIMFCTELHSEQVDEEVLSVTPTNATTTSKKKGM